MALYTFYVSLRQLYTPQFLPKINLHDGIAYRKLKFKLCILKFLYLRNFLILLIKNLKKRPAKETPN